MKETDLCYTCKEQKPVEELVCNFITRTDERGEEETLMVFVCKTCRESENKHYV